jgi:hypothetical protein
MLVSNIISSFATSVRFSIDFGHGMEHLGWDEWGSQVTM